MAKEQMTFNLGIKTTADLAGINTLKSSLKELDAQISNIDFASSTGFDTKELSKASQSIRALGAALDTSFDKKLNGINFNTFQKQLANSGTSLKEIGINMSRLGTQGQAAFAQTTSQVFKMNEAVKYSNKITTKLFDTFKNTAMYTAFNAVFNTISKSISQAVNYVEKLDTSLNNIRIVSGQTAEQMQEFAAAANESAKALGTATTEYTDAALIYYQQGLDADEVAARTDVTVKMANATGESAQKISEDMTAIWNNFYDGSKSLEYYSDVITALGASTASSSSEIATGLEKFAAIGDTVGLSYEYATSALATVVAETRQSADTVGTAFKTIFARLQGLELGDTLDDGTNLNKYSKALSQVGISIKDSNGNLKEMDDILDEMGSKWQTLSKDQQVALAQTVAGTRQYTQLVALMDNWDTFGNNLETVANASGTLQKQQDTYMESTAAHLEKLKATSEDLYSSLFDTKSINNWIDAFTKGIEVINNLVESLGGLDNIAPMLIFGGINAMSGQLASSIGQSYSNKAAQDSMMTSENAKQSYLSEFNLSQSLGQNSTEITQTSVELAKQVDYYKEMHQYREQMSKYQIEEYNNLCEAGAELVKQTSELEAQVELYNEKSAKLVNVNLDNADAPNKINQAYISIKENLDSIGKSLIGQEEEAEVLKKVIQDCYNEFSAFERAQSNSCINMEELDTLFEEALATITDDVSSFNDFKSVIESAISPMRQVSESLTEVRVNSEILSQQRQNSLNTQEVIATSQAYIQLASSIGQIAMGLNTVKNIGNIFNRDDLTVGEKIVQLLMNVGMVAPMLANGYKTVSKALNTLWMQTDTYKNKAKAAEEEITAKAIQESQKRIEQAEKEYKAKKGALGGLRSHDTSSGYNDRKEFVNSITSVEEADEQISLSKNAIANGAGAEEGILLKQLEAKKAMLIAQQQLNEATAQHQALLNGDTAAEVKNTGATKANTGATGANVGATNAENVAEGKNIVLKNADSMATKGLAISEKIASVATMGLKAAFEMLKGAAASLLNPMTAIMIIIGIASAIHGAWKKSLEDTAKANEELANTQREKTETLKEEAEKINELKDSYNDLLEQKEKNEISNEEFNQQVYELCMQYGEEELAVKALSGAYKDLNEAMDEIAAKRNQSAAESAKTTLELDKQTLSSKIHANEGAAAWDVSASGRSTYDVRAWYSADADDAQAEDLQKFAQDTIGKDIFENGDYGHVDIEYLAELYAEDKEGLLEVLNESNSGWSKRVLELLSGDNREFFDQYSEDYNSARELDVTALKSAYDEDVNNYEEYLAKRREIENELADVYYDEEERRTQANEIVRGMGENASMYGANETIASAIAGEDEGAIEDLTEQLNGLSAEQRQLIALTPQLAKSYIDQEGTLAEFVEGYDDYVEILKKQNQDSYIDSALATIKENDRLTQDDIDTLFNDEDFVLKIGEVELDQDAFEGLTSVMQKEALQLSKIISIAMNPDGYAEETIAALTEMQTAATEALGEAEAPYKESIDNMSKATEIAADDIKKSIESLDTEAFSKLNEEDIQSFSNFSMPTFDELNSEAQSKILNSYADDRASGLIDTTQITSVYEYYDAVISGAEEAANASYKLENSYTALADASDKELQSMWDYLKLIDEEKMSGIDTLEDFRQYVADNPEYISKMANAWDDYNSVLKSYNPYKEAQIELANIEAAIADAENSTIDWVTAIDEVTKSIQNTSKSFDTLQSSYKSMRDIVKDFNDDGKITIDNLQSLLNLEPEYLACLSEENGKLTLNEQAIDNLVNSKLELAKAQVYEQGLLQISAILESNQDVLTTQLTYDEYQQAKARGTLANMTLTLTQAESAYQDALSRTKNLTSEQRRAIAEVEKDVNTRIQALSNVDLSLGSLTGSKSSSSKKKDLKYLDDEFDRYWDIKKALDIISNAMDRLDKKQSKLHGKELISSLKEENRLLEMQATQYKALAEEQGKELTELNKKLGDIGFVFDGEGRMQNYKAQTAQLLNDFNAVTEAYNAGTIDSDSYDAASKQYEQAKKLISRYDALIKEQRETQNNLDEVTRKAKENNLQAWEVELQLKLDTKEAERDWNDFYGKVNEDFKSIYKDYGNSFKVSLFDAKSLSSSFNDELQAIQDVKAEIDKMNAGGSSDKFESISDAQDKLKSLSEQWRDDAEKVFDLYEDGWDDFNSYIDEATGKMDKLNKKFERINDDLDHQSKLIKLLYGENDYNDLNSLYQAQENNLLGAMRSLRTQADFYAEEYKQMSSLYGEDSEAAQKFKEAWETALDDLHAKEETYLETLAEKYSNTLNKAFSDFEKRITNGSNLDWVSEQWDLQKEAAEDVYDEQERIYELQKLSNKYQESINKASTTKAQQKLQKVYESQVESLKEKEKLTKYDVELAEKRLAVAEAEAALEDARNAKNSMKVTRGEDGNWSYQYVADEDDIANKEQALADASSDVYEYVKTNVQETIETMMKLATDYESKIKELQEKMVGATDEEKKQYQEQINWYESYYNKRVTELSKQLQEQQVDLAAETGALLQVQYNIDSNNYALMTEEQKSYIDGLREHSITCATDIYNASGETLSYISETGQQVANDTISYFDTAAAEIANSWINDSDSVQSSMTTALAVCDEAMKAYGEEVSAGCEAAGENFTNVGAAIDEDTKKTNELKDATDELVDEVKERIDEYNGYLENLEDLWNKVKDAVDANKDSIELYLGMVGSAIKETADLINNINEATAAQNALNNARNGSGSGGNSDKDNNKSSDTNKNKEAGGFSVERNENGNFTIRNLETMNSLSGDRWFFYDYLMDEKYGRYNESSFNYLMGAINSLNKNESTIVKLPSDAIANLGFSTGGYTGEWQNGSEDGRLALLHQKELVLNESDTANILEAVDSVRSISNIGSVIQNAIAGAVAAALSGISGTSNIANGYITNNSNSSNNTYNINAPIQTSADVDEIKEAILSLPTLAAQRNLQK